MSKEQPWRICLLWLLFVNSALLVVWFGGSPGERPHLLPQDLRSQTVQGCERPVVFGNHVSWSGERAASSLGPGKKEGGPGP